MSSTRWIPGPRDVAGTLAVVATLALLSPGVALEARAEADSPDASSHAAAIADGPTCGGGPSAEELSMQIESWVAMMNAEAVAQQPPPGAASPADGVALNNRGFNYAPERLRDPARGDGERPLR